MMMMTMTMLSMMLLDDLVGGLGSRLLPPSQEVRESSSVPRPV